VERMDASDAGQSVNNLFTNRKGNKGTRELLSCTTSSSHTVNYTHTLLTQRLWVLRIPIRRTRASSNHSNAPFYVETKFKVYFRIYIYFIFVYFLHFVLAAV
jgi:hypothetical protein